MGLLDKIRGELIDIVEWVDDSRHILVWRFPRYQNEIKNGAHLIVRPGQMAVFVHRGELTDVFEPGHHRLDATNLPVLSTLQGWKHGFNSPFKAEVYFVTTRQITDLKWGTPNPVPMRDADFGPIRVRAFGSYTLRARTPDALLRELVGTDSTFEADEIALLLRAIVNNAFAELVARSGISVVDLASRYGELSDELRTMVTERVDDEYGLEIPQLYIVNVSFPEEVERALDARSSIGILGDMAQYQHYQLGRSMPVAAENPAGGLAGAGVGVGMGMAITQHMAPGGPGMLPGPLAGPGLVEPPPLPATWHVADGGQALGPFTPAELAAAVRSGRVGPTTLVWTPGLSGWSPAGDVTSLKALFPPEPPPLPDAG